MTIYNLLQLPSPQRNQLIKDIVAYGDKKFHGRKSYPHAEVSKEEIVGMFLDAITERLLCGEIELP